MKVYAIRCIKDNPTDEKLTWRVGDWQGRITGNPVQNFNNASTQTNRADADRDLKNLKMFNQFGVDFEIVEFVPTSSQEE